MTDALATGRRTMRLEGDAILTAGSRLDESFTGAVALLATASRVVVSGIGKSGTIAQKIAATFTSTGTPAAYVHPVESLHGDLGIVDGRTVAILLSKSGETEEIFGLLSALARMQVPIIAITGDQRSTLGRLASIVLDGSVGEEACPHDLAPTSSTAVALALGDALAMALLERKGFGREDFAALHPGGKIGRRLLLRVRDVMVSEVRPLAPDSSMQQVVVELAHARGLAVIGQGGRICGVITAGDLTRLAERQADFLRIPARAVMTREPHTVRDDQLAAAALSQLEQKSIMAAPVLDSNDELVGVIHLHDLLRSGAG